MNEPQPQDLSLETDPQSGLYVRGEGEVADKRPVHIGNKHSVYIGEGELALAVPDFFTIRWVRSRALWRVAFHLGYRCDTGGWIHDRSRDDDVSGKVVMRNGCEYEFLDGTLQEQEYLASGSHAYTFHFRTVKKNGEEMDPLRY